MAVPQERATTSAATRQVSAWAPNHPWGGVAATAAAKQKWVQELERGHGKPPHCTTTSRSLQRGDAAEATHSHVSDALHTRTWHAAKAKHYKSTGARVNSYRSHHSDALSSTQLSAHVPACIGGPPAKKRAPQQLRRHTACVMHP